MQTVSILLEKIMVYLLPFCVFSFQECPPLCRGWRVSVCLCGDIVASCSIVLVVGKEGGKEEGKEGGMGETAEGSRDSERPEGCVKIE